MTTNSIPSVRAATAPNMGECWGAGTATFMILWGCLYKVPVVSAQSRPEGLKNMTKMSQGGLPRPFSSWGQTCGHHSVNRDELPDSGAEIWYQTVRRTKELCPETTIETLIPDVKSRWQALDRMISGGQGSGSTIWRLSKDVSSGKHHRPGMKSLGADSMEKISASVPRPVLCSNLERPKMNCHGRWMISRQSWLWCTHPWTISSTDTASSGTGWIYSSGPIFCCLPRNGLSKGFKYAESCPRCVPATTQRDISNAGFIWFFHGIQLSQATVWSSLELSRSNHFSRHSLVGDRLPCIATFKNVSKEENGKMPIYCPSQQPLIL